MWLVRLIIILLCAVAFVACDPHNVIAGGGQAMVSGTNNPTTINNGVSWWQVAIVCGGSFFFGYLLGYVSPARWPTVRQLIGKIIG